jgi:GxxExxY protein
MGFTTEARRTQRRILGRMSGTEVSTEARSTQRKMGVTHNELSGLVIKAAIAVHRALGPGLLESVYQVCLLQELRDLGLRVEEQVAVPIIYKGNRLANDLRIDLLVDDRIVVEVKAVLELHPIHTAQLLTYLKLTDKKLGLLINFNVEKLVDGIERKMNGYLEEGE